MPTVIDSLIVELGLDPSKLNKGQQDAISSFKKTKEAAATAGKDIEDSGKKASQFFSQLQGRVIALFAAFTAGKGLKEFITDVSTTDALTGRLAKTLDTTSNVLSAWRGMAVLVGGTAQGVTGSIQNLVTQFQEFSMTGESSVIPYFRALGVNIADSNGRMRATSDILLDLAGKFEGMDPARAAAFGKALGLDEGTINLLIKGRAAVQGMLDDQKRLGVITAADAEAGAALQRAWGELTQAGTSLGRTLVTAVTPILVKVLEVFTDLAVWARDHQPLVQAAFVGLAAVAVVLGAALLIPSAAFIGIAAAIAAVIAAGALLYDDWQTWMNGGKSLFGDFFDFVAALFTGSAEDIKRTWNALFGDLSGSFDGFIDYIKNIAPKVLAAFKQAFMGAIDWVEGRVNAVWGAIFGKKLFNAPSGAAGGAQAPSTPDAKGDIGKLMGMGWTKEQATGIAANLQRESGGNHQAVGDNGKAYGIAQWHPDRQAAFKAWSGKDIQSSSRDEQLAFLNYEMRSGSEQKAGRALMGATSAEDAARIVSSQYERPKDSAGEASTRAAIATALARADAPAGLAANASTMAAAGGVANDNRSSSTSSTTVGQIVVNTQATDAAGIARDIGPAVERNSFATHANYGPS